jgi:hypothetical protein
MVGFGMAKLTKNPGKGLGLNFNENESLIFFRLNNYAI